jgi:hypothetical protein
MSVDDPRGDPARVDRPGDEESNDTGRETESGSSLDARISAERASSDRPRPTALRATGSSLTIEFGRESGEIRLHRETALGTYTESVDR